MAKTGKRTIGAGMAKLLGTQVFAIKPHKNDFAIKMKTTPAGEVPVILIPEFDVGSFPLGRIRKLAKQPRLSIPGHAESLGVDSEVRIIVRGGHGRPVVQALDDEMAAVMRYIQKQTGFSVAPTDRVHERRPI